MQNRVYSVGDRPAELWAMRAEYTPRVVRAAMGENLRRLRERRAYYIRTTIYERGRQFPGRFTNRLKNSEYAYFKGAAAIVENKAARNGFKYAQRRATMRGYSKRLNMRKESFFHTKALRDVRPTNNATIRRALRQANSKKVRG